MSTATATVRPVTDLDIGAIEAIDEQLTDANRPGHWETQVSYYVGRNNDSALVAEVGGEVRGFLFGDIRGWEFGLEKPTGWIEIFGVDPSAQGQGVARALFDQLLANWRERHVASARTMVDNSDEQLTSFVKKLGMASAPVTTYEMSL